MDLNLMLSASNLASTAVTSFATSKYSSKVAKAKQKTLDAQYQFNKKQIEEAYKTAFNNTMTNYIFKRNEQADAFEQANVKINEFASQNNINLASSSVQDDLESTLELEYTTNLQNLYSNMLSTTSNLASAKVSQEYNIHNNYLDNKSLISNTLNDIKLTSMNNVLNSSLNFASDMFSDYSTYKAKNKDSTLSNYFSSFKTK